MGGIIITIIFIIVMCKIWGQNDFLHDTGKGCLITIAIVGGGLWLISLFSDDNDKLDTILTIVIIGIFILGILKIMIDTSKETPEDKNIIYNDDTSSSQTNQNAKISSHLKLSLQELDSLIGLENVKQQVHTLIKFIQVQQERDKHNLKTTPISYHCVFSGSPGTGKTTVARILAQIYKDLGILKEGHLIITKNDVPEL